MTSAALPYYYSNTTIFCQIGPGLCGDESFDKCCIFGNEVHLTCKQRDQLCSIVEELPMPLMKHYVFTLMNSNVIPGEGKMVSPPAFFALF
jgi:hypothetical protein